MKSLTINAPKGASLSNVVHEIYERMPDLPSSASKFQLVPGDTLYDYGARSGDPVIVTIILAYDDPRQEELDNLEKIIDLVHEIGPDNSEIICE